VGVFSAFRRATVAHALSAAQIGCFSAWGRKTVALICRRKVVSDCDLRRWQKHLSRRPAGVTDTVDRRAGGANRVV